MDAASFVAIFLPMVSGVTPQRRSPETFVSVSIITGREIALRTTGSPDRERRIDAYRRSRESRLLNLTD